MQPFNRIDQAPDTYWFELEHFRPVYISSICFLFFFPREKERRALIKRITSRARPFLIISAWEKGTDWVGTSFFNS